MKISKYILGFIALSGLFSCQKVITIELNKTNPQLVIDARINDLPGPYTVTLSQTTDYFTPGTYPTISGAKISITDNGTSTDNLIEVSPGTYKTVNLKGTPGHTYVLNISYNGKTYTAQTTMPQPVGIDNLVDTLTIGRNGRERITLRGFFTDPVGTDNYYNMHFYRNDSLLDSNRYIIYSDKLVDGKQADIPYRRGFNIGDSVTMELLSIDKATYDFYRTANDILDRGSQLTSAAPSNPVTNVSTGAVGYFSAYCTRKKKILIQ